MVTAPRTTGNPGDRDAVSRENLGVPATVEASRFELPPR